MKKTNGGVIGEEITPTGVQPDASASGVWNLKDVESHEKAGDWPQPNIPPDASGITYTDGLITSPTQLAIPKGQTLTVSFADAADLEDSNLTYEVIIDSGPLTVETTNPVIDNANPSFDFLAGEVTIDTPVTFTIKVTDDFGMEDSKTFAGAVLVMANIAPNLTDLKVNGTPIASFSWPEIKEGTNQTFTLSGADDEDGNPALLKYEAGTTGANSDKLTFAYPDPSHNGAITFNAEAIDVDTPVDFYIRVTDELTGWTDYNTGTSVVLKNNVAPDVAGFSFDIDNTGVSSSVHMGNFSKLNDYVIDFSGVIDPDGTDTIVYSCTGAVDGNNGPIDPSLFGVTTIDGNTLKFTIGNIQDDIAIAFNIFSTDSYGDSTPRTCTATLKAISFTSATGGNPYTYIVGGVTYTSHTFTGSDAFEVTQVATNGTTIDYLMVAGGGGGGNHAQPGGGGAGGLIYQTGLPITAIGTYPVVVGGGGDGAITNSGGYSGVGLDTTFNGLTALGGGGGNSYGISNQPTSGGCGGAGGSKSGSVRGLTTQSSLHTITPYGAVINTTIKKFGTSSIYHFANGTGTYAGDNIKLGSSSDFAYGTDDFTIECWVKFNSVNGCIYDGRQTSTADRLYKPLINVSSGTISYTVNASVEIGASTSGVIGTTVFHHIAVSRNGTSTRMFVDGNQVGSTWTTDSTNYNTLSVGPTMGTLFDNRYGKIDGYMDEIRISDTARYTSAFDVATSAFEADANTLLLIHGDATIQDDRYEEYGNDGGYGNYGNAPFVGGGGGGAGAVGQDNPSNGTGAGGIGKSYDLEDGTSKGYAGGGAGGSWGLATLADNDATYGGGNGDCPRSGGSNNAVNGSWRRGDTDNTIPPEGYPGVANKGAGGGAAGRNGAYQALGGNGGKGVVVIRYISA